MPPKKNKKPSRNGYWEFVLDCRNKPHNKNLGQEELKNYASKKWNAMSKEDRQPYEDRAKLARDSFSVAKLTNDGVEIEEVERQEREKVAKILDMKDDINKLVKAAHFSLMLGDQVFLLIHVNHLIHYPPEDRYFICEVAIAALSLKNGIEDVYHSVVYNGALPMGYNGEAMHQSKETHQLYAVVMEEPIQNNVAQVFTEMTQFIKSHSIKSSVPIVYAGERNLDVTKNVIDNLREEFRYEGEIKVYCLEYLFHVLKNTAANQPVWQTESNSYNIIEKDLYSHTTGIGCEYHEMIDATIHCSKSIVRRYGFTICDFCCEDLDIKMVPGFHLPAKARVETESRSTSLAASVVSHDEYRTATSGRSRVDDALSATSYESSFPALTSHKSTGSSLESFSSLRSGQTHQTKSKAASRIEQSFKAFSLNEAKRDPRNLKFPEHRHKKPEN